MKITAQEEYGLRCLLQLAQADQEAGMSVKEIATREGISPAYVEKLLRLMAKADIIHSVRGIHGGYRLNRRPDAISLRDVVRALGNLPTTEEICDRHPGNRTSCIHIDECCIRSAWATLTHAIDSFMGKVLLSDLVGPEATVKQALQHKVATPFSV